MRKINVFFLWMIVLGCLPALGAYDGLPQEKIAREELADRVVARVNETAITLSELEEAVIERRLADPESQSLPPRQIYEEELARLIDDELIYQAASKNKIDAPPEMVAARVEEIITSLERSLGSMEKVEEMLKEQGLTIQRLKELIQRREQRQIIIVRAISSRFTITEADVKEFESDLRFKGQIPTGYYLRHILIAVPDNATPAQVEQCRERAFEAGLKAQKEMTFEEAAKTYSQDEDSRLKGGLLGYVSEGSMMPELERAVKNLKVGQISQPVRSDTGWHVFKLENVRSARKILFAKRFEEERLNLISQLRRTMSIETQMEFLDAIPDSRPTAENS